MSFRARWSFLTLFAIASVCIASGAQQTPTPAPPDQNPDAQVVTQVDTAPRTPTELKEDAWTILTNGVNDRRSPDQRSQALSAAGFLGSQPRSLDLIRGAMKDPDIDIRTAAVLAAGQSKAPPITTDLRQLLDDKEPPVAFAAALSLYKMKDYSGEDILMAVADGNRTTTSGRKDSAEHTLSKDLHHPSSVARFAAMQGAGIVLGPFGYGITAVEYLRKNGGDASRVAAIEALATNHTTPIRDELVAALIDKDPGVRQASAKALAAYHEPQVSAALAKDFADEKAPVRFTAAAAYLISSGAAPGAPDPNRPVAVARKR